MVGTGRTRPLLIGRKLSLALGMVTALVTAIAATCWDRKELDMSKLFIMPEMRERYAINSILTSMDTVERLTDGMFHVVHPVLEREFWLAYEAHDLRKLGVVKERVNTLVDYYNGCTFDGDMPDWAK